MTRLKERVEYIILGVAATIFTLYHAILTNLVVTDSKEEGLSFLFVLGVEGAAFLPLGVAMFYLMRISRSNPAFFTTFSTANIIKHSALALGVFAIHAVWQQFVNSYFFGSDFTPTMVFRDFLIFSKMRYLVYITVVGIIAGLIKLKQRQSMQLKSSELRLKLQKAKMRELELKMNPEIIYPNLDFIKTKTLEKPEEASQMVILMASFLRKLVDTIGEEKLSLSDEVRLFSLYAELCRLKLQRYIEVDSAINPDYVQIKVPSLLVLVPIFEELLFGAYKDLLADFTGFGFYAGYNAKQQFEVQINCKGLSKAEKCARLLLHHPLLQQSQEIYNELEFATQYKLLPSANAQTLSLTITVIEQGAGHV